MTKIADGDSPDTIVITFGRCNLAAEIVEDLVAIAPPHQWLTLSVMMLDRDLLADDEWWAALLRRRNRTQHRHPPNKLPSYATRVTAGHMLAVAAATAAHVTGLTPTLSPMIDPDRLWTMATAAPVALDAAGGRCQADGLHHPDCPGDIDTTYTSTFVPHHVFPREKAKQLHVPAHVVDNPANLLIVWNGHTRLGAGGCHGRIHAYRTAARDLGLLAPSGAVGPAGWTPPTP